MAVTFLAVMSPCFCHCLRKKCCFHSFTQNKTESKLVTNKPDLSARARKGWNLFMIEASDSEGEEYSGFEKNRDTLDQLSQQVPTSQKKKKKMQP